MSMLPGKTRVTFFSSLSSLLSFCSTIRVLQQVHARFILHGLHQNPSLSSDLLCRYGELGRLDLSQRVFGSINDHSALLYNSIIRTMSMHDELERALLFYREMLEKSLSPDEAIYPFIIKSCSEKPCLRKGEMVHCHLVKLGFDSCFHVSAAITEMYGTQGEISNALCMIESVSATTVVSWNTLISAASQSGDPMESFRVFGAMILEGIAPDSTTIVSLLRTCVDLKSVRMGQLVHVLAVVNGLGTDTSVSTTFLAMYCKLGSLKMARLLFDNVHEKDCVVWNTMISGYSRNGLAEQALDLLSQMGKEGIRTDLFTAIASLSSVACLGLLKLGKEIHGHVVRNGSDNQVSVYNALIDMYSKCKSLQSARNVFDMVVNKTVISWSAMMKGYLNNDHPSEALLVFDKMRVDGVRPDSITLIDILPACVHLAALQRVRSIHSYVIKQGLNPLVSLVTALLVTYAKCGCIEMAQKLFDEENDHRDIVLWNSMISAYSKHGNWSRCFELYHQMVSLEVKPDQLTFLGLLTASVCSGLVKEGRQCFHQMVDVYGYHPEKEHYACMVDLLGRSGHLDEAMMLIKTMPFEPDAQVWGPLLSACKLHSDTRLAEFAAGKLIDTEPQNAGNYILLSNIYAAAGKWDGVARMRGFLRGGGLKKTPGYSWLEINGHVHEFRVADRSHPESENIYRLLKVTELEIKMDDNMYTEVYS